MQQSTYPANPGGKSVFYTAAPAAPSAFTYAHQLAPATTAGQYTLTWTEPSDTSMVRYYNIYAKDGSAPTAVQQARIASVPKGTVKYIDWAGNPDGSTQYIITSVDYQGNESESSVLGSASDKTVTENNPVPDTTLPTTNIISPASDATVSGSITVVATATDNVGISHVEFYQDSVLRAAVNTPPYSYNLDTTTLANGSHTLSAKAYDAAGNSSLYSETVIVSNGDVVLPTVTLTSPASNSILSGFVTISASAVDSIGVTKVEIYIGKNLLLSTSTAPYNYVLNTNYWGNGSYTVTAKAYDAAGNVAIDSVVITIFNDITAPTISVFALPTTASTQTVPITSLSATDNVAVTGYMLTESSTVPDKAASGWSATAPSSYTFATTGTKTLYAWAKDAAGNVSAAKTATTVISLPKTVTSDVLLVDTATTYPTIQDAYNTLTDTGTIATTDVALTGDVTFDQAVNVTLDGGLDPTFQTTTGTTAVTGSIKISKGKVVVKKIVVR